MKYNLSRIMSRAWQLFKKLEISFSEALHRAWLVAKAEPINAKRIEDAKNQAGITEEINTWHGWQSSGYMVRHGSKSILGVDLIHGSKGDGAIYKARFFGLSQVESMA